MTINTAMLLIATALTLTNIAMLIIGVLIPPKHDKVWGHVFGWTATLWLLSIILGLALLWWG